MKIKFFGDSLVRGFGVSRDKNWVYLLGKDNYNYGENGGRISDTYKIIEKSELLDYSFFMVGINDIISGASSEFLINGTDEIIKLINKKNSRPILGISPCASEDKIDFFAANDSVSEYIRYKLGAFRDYYLENENKIFLIDFNRLFKQLENEGKNVFLDGLHPNTWAHQKMAEFFKKEVENELQNAHF